MEKQVAPPAAPEPELSVEALFDFDRLVEQLGAETPPSIQALDALAASVDAARPSPVPAPSPDDPFSQLEHGLREREAQPLPAHAAQTAANHDAEVLVELEDWLHALRSSS